MTKIYYLAHPYTGNIEENVKKSIEATNKLLDLGYKIFNPLTHSHSLDMNKSREPQFWYDLDIDFLRKMNGIILGPKWYDSKGCINEFNYAIHMIRENRTFQILLYEEIIKHD